MKKDEASVVIPERYARVLRMLTHESDLELAIAIVLKEVVHYRLRDALAVIKTFEGRYGMNFLEFEQARVDGMIPDSFSPSIEKDSRDWNTAESEREMLLSAQSTLDKAYPGLRERKVISVNRGFLRHCEEGVLPDEAVSRSHEGIASGKPPSQ